jgi:hypothetical protein
VSRYVDEHRGRFGVEPICRVLGVSASAYYEQATGRRSARSIEDERLLARIREVHERSTAPTATGAPGSPCAGRASRPVAAGCSG